METEVITKVMAIVSEYCRKRNTCYLCPLEENCEAFPQDWVIRGGNKDEEEDEEE